MASVFELTQTTVANVLRGVAGLGGLTVQERKAPIKLDKDTLNGIYVGPVSERPTGYAFAGVVMIEYSLDVVLVARGDQQLDPPNMSDAPNRVELIRLALDVGGLPGLVPTLACARWEMVNNLYDRSALSNNYDRTALRFYYQSDEVRQ